MSVASADSSRVFVTGCSTGIGRACALEFAARGYRVVATARDLGSISDLPVEERLSLDVVDERSVHAAVAAAGPIDVLVNNAGITAWGPVELLPVDVVRRVFETNVIGALRVSQGVLPGMRARRRGRIINVSTAALRGFPLLGIYVATKAALEAISESLRFEVAGFGIDVVLAEPGPVHSSFASNRTVIDVRDVDYGPQQQRALGVLNGMRTEPMTSADVAREIVALAEADAPRFRTPIGADAERLVKERRTVDDEDYEAGVLAALMPAE